jgi:hypothetical protein
MPFLSLAILAVDSAIKDPSDLQQEKYKELFECYPVTPRVIACCVVFPVKDDESKVRTIIRAERYYKMLLDTESIAILEIER